MPLRHQIKLFALTCLSSSGMAGKHLATKHLPIHIPGFTSQQLHECSTRTFFAWSVHFWQPKLYHGGTFLAAKRRPLCTSQYLNYRYKGACETCLTFHSYVQPMHQGSGRRVETKPTVQLWGRGIVYMGTMYTIPH